MQSRLSPAIRLIAASAIVAASVLTPVAARTPALDASFEPAATVESEAEEMFSDASFGVDPMVTGPVSDEFRQKQDELGCAEAKWPAIPAGCYPR